MKKQTIQSIAKRFFLGNLAVALMFLSANATLHPNKNIGTVYNVSGNAEVKYTGVDANNLLSFKVKYNNTSGNNFILTVIDEDGQGLFKGVYSDNKFEKTFKLPKSEVNKVTFVLEDTKTSVKEKFTVNVKTNVSEEVIVSKG